MSKAKAKAAPAPAPPPDDDRFKTVLPFVRGVCALLPNEVPDADQQHLLAVAVRMSAFDRDKLLGILRRGCGEE